MLVLSRKTSEKIRINDDIEIVVVSIRGGRVRLGFDGPKDVTIHRSEVYDAIKKSQSDSDAEDQVKS